MRDILRKAKTQRLDDLIALNALYRPGPLRSGMVDDFMPAGRPGEGELRSQGARADSRRHVTVFHCVSGTGDAIASVLAGFTSAKLTSAEGYGKKKAASCKASERSSSKGRWVAASTRRRPRRFIEPDGSIREGYGFNNVTLDGLPRCLRIRPRI